MALVGLEFSHPEMPVYDREEVFELGHMGRYIISFRYRIIWVVGYYRCSYFLLVDCSQFVQQEMHCLALHE